MKNMLYACSYVPVEIVTAAGFTPVWLLPDSDPQHADHYIHSITCPYVRQLCAAVLDEKASTAEGIVLTNSCDGMRRLADVLAAYRSDLPVLFLDVPQKSDPASIDLFAMRLREFTDTMAETFPETAVDDDALWRTIGEYNQVRLGMEELLMQLRTATPIVSGSEVYQLSREAITSRVDTFLPSLKRFLSHISGRKREMSIRNAPRLMLYGNILTAPDLVRIMEDSGALVVSLNHCFGERAFDRPVETEGNSPYEALAHRYLTRSTCPRMEGLDERITEIASLAEESTADGVIYCSVTHCDNFLYDAPHVVSGLKEKDIPVLVITHDGEWRTQGQVETRIEAFVETIQSREVSRYA